MVDLQTGHGAAESGHRIQLHPGRGRASRVQRAESGDSQQCGDIETELKPDSEGVLYALGAFSGGLSLWVDKGKLNFEYNLFEIERTRIETTGPLPTGKVKIEVETRIAAPRGTGDIAIRIDGKEVAKGRVPRTAIWAFTTNDAFDVGQDSYSPVSLAYSDRAPFKFNGKIDTVYIKYLDK
jgi:hypothetical protein